MSSCSTTWEDSVEPSEETLARESDRLLALTILGSRPLPPPPPVLPPAEPVAPAIVVAETSLLNTLWDEVGILGALLGHRLLAATVT